MKKFTIHPISIIVWLWLLFVLGMPMALSYVFAIVIHELGHYFVAKKCGYLLSKFSISPYGFGLSYFQQNLDHRHEFLIALAGPLANFVSVFLILGIWWLFPMAYFFTADFVEVSVLLALFNLLPAYPMDGGRIFVSGVSHFFSEKTAKKITIWINVFLSLIFFVLFCVFCFINFNPTFLLFAVFLVVGVLDLNFVTRFDKVNIFCKSTKNFVRPVVCCINSSVTIGELLKKIQTSKTYVFCLVLDNGRIVNLSEKMVVNLSLKFAYDQPLGDVLKK